MFTVFLVVDFRICRLFSICFSVIFVDKVSVLRVSRVISRKLKSIFLKLTGQLTNLIVHAFVVAIRWGVSILRWCWTRTRAWTRLVVWRSGAIAVIKNICEIDVINGIIKYLEPPSTVFLCIQTKSKKHKEESKSHIQLKVE